MSIDIYAGIVEDYNGRPCMGPVIPFEHWKEEILADDADERHERGEDPFIPNPNYVPNAGLNLSNGNARLIFDLIGMPLDEEGFGDFNIDAVQKALLKARNGKVSSYTEETRVEQGAGGCTMVSCGVEDGYMEARLSQLLNIVTEGRKRGATHICAC